MRIRRLDEINERRAEDREMYKGVEALGFHTFECNARYHAIGVYRVNGKLTARCVSDAFIVRVPNTAKKLYLQAMYEGNAGRMVQEQFQNLPPELEALINDCAAAQEEDL